MSTETGLLKQWPEEGPELLWTAKGLGHGYSGVAIAQRRICTAGNIDGDRVICCPGGEEAAVVALDKMTGQVAWKCPGIGVQPGYSSPRLVEYQGLRIIIVLMLKAIVGVNADTGELLFNTERQSLFDENVLTPVIHDGHLFVSGLVAGSIEWKINVDGRKASVEEVWTSKAMDNHHDGVILTGGHLYGSSCLLNRGKWICLDWETGEMKYAERGVGKGSITYADGMLYTLSEKTKMGLVRPTPDAHELVSQFSLPEGGEGTSWAHPVVCGGRLYIRHGEFLYVYDVRARR